MDNCNGLITPTKVEAPLGTDTNGYEAKRYCTNSYASVIGMILYLASNKIRDIYFDIHQCARFTNNTKASHETYTKRIFQYLQGTKDNGLVLNPSEKLVLDCYSDEDFAGLCGNKILNTLFLIELELDLW